MEIDAILKKYRKRLVIEAVIKSVLFALVLGFAANLLYTFVDWLLGLKAVFIGVAIGGGVALVSGILLYFLKYRPTEKQIAQRLDALGLLERIITMNELKNDNSYMAKRQREDAAQAVSKVSTSMLKVAVSSVLVIMVAVSLVFSAGFTVAAQTADKSGVKLIDEIINGERQEYHVISYDVDGDGVIEGEQEQEVKDGEDGEEVTAVPEDGWMFVMWSDGLTEPTRRETAVKEDVEVFAIFMEAEESEEAESSEDGDPSKGENEGEGDGETDHPQEGQPGDGDSGDGAPNDDSESSEQQQSDNPSNDPGDGAGGGRHNSGNQIIDGQSYYGDYYDDAVSDASENGSGSGSSLVSGYISGLQANGGGN